MWPTTTSNFEQTYRQYHQLNRQPSTIKTQNKWTSCLHSTADNKWMASVSIVPDLME
jgi:hypothetical protein